MHYFPPYATLEESVEELAYSNLHKRTYSQDLPWLYQKY